MTEIERIIWNGIDEKTKSCMDCCTTEEHCKKIAKAIEQYVQEQKEKIRDSVVEQANVQLEQEVIKARIEELDWSLACSAEHMKPEIKERIAQLKKGLE